MENGHKKFTSKHFSLLIDDKTVGVVFVFKRIAHHFTLDNLKKLSLIENNAGTITQVQMCFKNNKSFCIKRDNRVTSGLMVRFDENDFQTIEIKDLAKLLKDNNNDYINV